MGFPIKDLSGLNDGDYDAPSAKVVLWRIRHSRLIVL